MYDVHENWVALEGYIQSMQCAVSKAANGSTVETMYFIEKLEKTANKLGYKLVILKDREAKQL